MAVPDQAQERAGQAHTHPARGRGVRAHPRGVAPARLPVRLPGAVLCHRDRQLRRPPGSPRRADRHHPERRPLAAFGAHPAPAFRRGYAVRDRAPARPGGTQAGAGTRDRSACPAGADRHRRGRHGAAHARRIRGHGPGTYGGRRQDRHRRQSQEVLRARRTAHARGGGQSYGDGGVLHRRCVLRQSDRLRARAGRRRFRVHQLAPGTAPARHGAGVAAAPRTGRDAHCLDGGERRGLSAKTAGCAQWGSRQRRAPTRFEKSSVQGRPSGRPCNRVQRGSATSGARCSGSRASAIHKEGVR